MSKETIAFLSGLSIGYMVAFIFLFWLIGCASAPTKAFNSEDKQDGTCYATLGGAIGYCNINERRK